MNILRVSIFTPKVKGKRELSIASDLAKENKFTEALDMAKQGLQIIRESRDPKEINYANARVLEIQALMHNHGQNLRSAIGAFGQSGRYYSQAEAHQDASRVMKVQAGLLIEVGKNLASEKKFESAAASYEEAAIAYKHINMEIEALEIRAKAYVFRAASVRNPSDRKNFLMKAVNLIKESGLDQPVVLGHLEYYSAMVHRMSDPALAVETLDRAIEHYQEAGNHQMIQTAQAMKQSILTTD